MIFEFRDSPKEIYLWNPLAEKYKILPYSPLSNTETHWNALAFGFVPEINDYIVVHIVKPRLHLGCGEPDPHSVIIGVYSLNANSWKKICQNKVFVSDINWFDVVFINGAAFWAADLLKLPATGTSCKVLPPAGTLRAPVRLLSLTGGQIAIVNAEPFQYVAHTS
ncbi:hypothetical protein AgCh_026520 [Apium graveolens]